MGGGGDRVWRRKKNKRRTWITWRRATHFSPFSYAGARLTRFLSLTHPPFSQARCTGRFSQTSLPDADSEVETERAQADLKLCFAFSSSEVKHKRKEATRERVACFRFAPFFSFHLHFTFFLYASSSLLFLCLFTFIRLLSLSPHGDSQWRPLADSWTVAKSSRGRDRVGLPVVARQKRAAACFRSYYHFNLVFFVFHCCTLLYRGDSK